MSFSGDTILALATPPGRSGVAIVRVSGPSAWESATLLINKNIAPRNAHLCNLIHPISRETIDKAVVVGFKAPASFTGEDVIEYHVHGGRAVIQSLIDALAEQPGHRMAGPGEFTRRAFENGKLDLTEAEAIADLINAETQAQKAQALAQLEGGLSRIYADWTERLKRALAHVEADIEFPDEDLPQGIAPEVLAGVEHIITEISAHLSDNRRGERLRDGIQVAVIGAPNAGKSSLVNALAQRDVAIVSDMAGTTRDVIEVHLDLGGYPVILADTAGLQPDQIGNSEQERIESEGIRRALVRAQQADIKLLVFDGAQAEPDKHTQALLDENSILVINKGDVADTLKLDRGVHVSAKTGQGLEQLIAALIEKTKTLMGGREGVSLTRARHRVALEEARDALNRGRGSSLPELMAEDLRLAVRALGRVTGRVDVEDLLDVIFKDFCIGK
jgi:tRNA modification GTPase